MTTKNHFRTWRWLLFEGNSQKLDKAKCNVLENGQFVVHSFSLAEYMNTIAPVKDTVRKNVTVVSWSDPRVNHTAFAIKYLTKETNLLTGGYLLLSKHNEWSFFGENKYKKLLSLYVKQSRQELLNLPVVDTPSAIESTADILHCASQSGGGMATSKLFHKII